MNQFDRLMSDVSEATYLAEGAIDNAVSAYERLLSAEQAIIDSVDSEITEGDREIAGRGVEIATETLNKLMAIINVEELLTKIEKFGEAKYDLAATGWEGCNSTLEKDEDAKKKCTDLFEEIRKLLGRS